MHKERPPHPKKAPAHPDGIRFCVHILHKTIKIRLLLFTARQFGRDRRPGLDITPHDSTLLSDDFHLGYSRALYLAKSLHKHAASSPDRQSYLRFRLNCGFCNWQAL